MKYSKRFFFILVLLITVYSINIKASLSVYPAEIRDSVLTGENKTAILYITNSTGTLSYQLSSDADWISFSSIYGDINAGDTISIIVSINAALLYNGANSVNIFVGDPHHGLITIPVEIYSRGGLTDIKENRTENRPSSFLLSQNYPNPFNPSTKIVYSIPGNQKVAIKVYNILGNEIMTLVNGERAKGSYSLTLDMNGYASGVYFYTIKTSGYTQTKKMILNR